MQTLDYYRSFPDDRITLRLFVRISKLSSGCLWFADAFSFWQVAVLAILDTASTALLMHTSWVFLIRGWGNIAVLQHLPVYVAIFFSSHLSSYHNLVAQNGRGAYRS
jgi:hypothetical protein